jgi:hypothetical protein
MDSPVALVFGCMVRALRVDADQAPIDATLAAGFVDGNALELPLFAFIAMSFVSILNQAWVKERNIVPCHRRVLPTLPSAEAALTRTRPLARGNRAVGRRILPRGLRLRRAGLLRDGSGGGGFHGRAHEETSNLTKQKST